MQDCDFENGVSSKSTFVWCNYVIFNGGMFCLMLCFLSGFCLMYYYDIQWWDLFDWWCTVSCLDVSLSFFTVAFFLNKLYLFAWVVFFFLSTIENLGWRMWMISVNLGGIRICMYEDSIDHENYSSVFKRNSVTFWRALIKYFYFSILGGVWPNSIFKIKRVHVSMKFWWQKHKSCQIVQIIELTS